MEADSKPDAFGGNKLPIRDVVIRIAAANNVAIGTALDTIIAGFTELRAAIGRSAEQLDALPGDASADSPG